MRQKGTQSIVRFLGLVLHVLYDSCGSYTASHEFNTYALQYYSLYLFHAWTRNRFNMNEKTTYSQFRQEVTKRSIIVMETRMFPFSYGVGLTCLCGNHLLDAHDDWSMDRVHTTQGHPHCLTVCMYVQIQIQIQTDCQSQQQSDM